MNKHFPSEIPKAQPKAASKKDIYTTMTKRQNKFEDTKGVIRSRESKKDRQHNSQKEKEQKDIQRSTKHSQKTKDRVTRTPLKTGGTQVLRKGRMFLLH